jgi:hypothetical protein
MRQDNQEQAFHPLYNYVLVTDATEGLILADINSLVDGEPRNNFLQRALTWNEGGILDGARAISVGGRYAYIAASAGVVILDLEEPLQPRWVATVAMNGVRSVEQQFRYLFVTDREGLKVIDITDPGRPQLLPDNLVPMAQANKVFVARTFAYVAAGTEGLYIVDVTRPEQMQLYQRFDDDIVDAQDVVVASTNASLFAYIADGSGGLKVVQLTSPESQPRYYGFSPDPQPGLIASFPTSKPALALSRGLERDRAVDETGGQVAVFSRLGSGPLSEADMRMLYLDQDGKPWFVRDSVTDVKSRTERP